MKRVKNIIFDLGGVLLHIDFEKTREAFERLGVSNYAAFFGQHHASPLFQDLETGKISPDTFYDGLRLLSGLRISNEDIRDAWNAMLGSFIGPNMALLPSLAARTNIFLFSNTNKIHYDCFAQECRNMLGRDLESYFTEAYYSHTLGLRKPTAASFNAIIDEQQLDPSETLFVDDTAENIAGAQSVCLQTFLLPSNAALEAILPLI